MKLLMEDLDTSLTQKFKATKNGDIYAIRPHIYVAGNPAGSLYVSLLDVNQKTIATSAAVTIASITSAAYFHGYVRFLVSAQVKKDQYYYVKLHSSGYTLGASFVALCKDFDLQKYDRATAQAWESAYDIEFWGYKNTTKGFY